MQRFSIIAVRLVAGWLFFGFPAARLSAQEVKEIPVEKTPPRPGLQVQGQGYSVTLEPATAASQKVEGGVSNSLQQQMRLAVEQAISPHLAMIYRVEAGFKTVETEILGQEELAAAYLSMLQRPALLWKPRADAEVETAYEKTDSLNQDFAWEKMDVAALRLRVKMSEQTSVSLTARAEEKSSYAGELVTQQTVQAPVEQNIANTPLKLVIGPGYQTSSAADGQNAIRAFVEQSLIWKMDDWTTLTVGSNTAPLLLPALSDSANYFLLVQHKVLPGASMEMKAALFQSQTDLASEGFAVSAQSTVALAEALSAGLSVRYKMDQNPTISRPAAETFLSFSINGTF